MTESDRGIEDLDERFALLAEAEQIAHMGSWGWNIHAGTVYWSDECYRILGLDPGQHQASIESFFAAVHPDDQAAMQRASDSMAESGKSRVLDVRIVRPSGEIRQVRMSSRKVNGSDGSPLRMVGTILDITEDLAQASKTTRSMDLMREAQRIANVGSWVLHVDSGKLEWTEQMYRITQNDPGIYEPTVERFFAFIHPDDRDRVTTATECAIAGKPQPIDCRILVEDGKVRHVAIDSRIERMRGSRAAILHGTMLDVTERKQLEAQLRQSQKMDALGKLAGGVAHDLNNYLQIIAGNIELLEQYAPQEEEEVRQARDDIHASLRLCSSLTRGLLAFSRQQNVEAQATDIHEVIQTSLGLVSKLLGAGIVTTTNLHADNSFVFCDPHQLEQVIFNLAINARDAMNGNGVLEVSTSNPTTTRLHPKASGPKGEIVIQVKDNGSGMSDEVKEQIFDPFFTTKAEGHGTGLGLSTAFGIIEQSDGVIRVESQEGEGTTVFLHLPLCSDLAPGVSPSKKQEEAPPSRSPLILVAEDEPMVRRMAVATLKRAGYQVVEASDGKKALDVLLSERGAEVDLVLSDVVMPHMGGADLVEQIDARNLVQPILLMSGYAERSHLEAGPLADRPLLPKPFARRDLLEAIAALLKPDKCNPVS